MSKNHETGEFIPELATSYEFVSDTENVFQSPQHPYTQLLLNSTLTVAQGSGVPDLNVDAAARHAMRDHPSFVVQ